MFRLIVIVFTFAPLTCWAIEDVAISINQVSQEIVQGMPLYLELELENLSEDEDVVVKISSFGRFSLSIAGDHVQTTESDQIEEWYPVGTGFDVEFALQAQQRCTKTIIVHRWATTWLTPGHYTVKGFLSEVLVGESSQIGRAISPMENILENPYRFKIPLEILPYEQLQVRQEYQRLQDLGRTSQFTPEKRLADDTIIFAQGPDALPYKLSLLRRAYVDGIPFETRENRLLEMFRMIRANLIGILERVHIRFVLRVDRSRWMAIFCKFRPMGCIQIPGVCD